MSSTSPNRATPPSLCYATQRQYRADLNNIAKKYRLKLAYADYSEGPPHNCRWFAQALVGEVPYGSGSAYTKGDAREAAAKEAVEVLESQGYVV